MKPAVPPCPLCRKINGVTERAPAHDLMRWFVCGSCPFVWRILDTDALISDAERRERIGLSLAYIRASTEDLRALALSVQEHASAVAHKKAANGS